ncbi:MAG: ABC transporter substrate-binding protein, partial [Burkholderiales bacterium]|nr:ABC transporter substrate-binding protein [Burkholderiales bacterium]
MSRFARAVRALCIGVAATAVFAAPALAQDKKSIKVGFVTYLSGPASGPFGVPAKIAAEAIVESLNAGKVPAPYQSVGIAGMPIELVIIDENGGATKQVSEFRTLVQRQNVDVVIGYIGSGDCLAIAPVADELKKITVLLDCGTPRVFEESSFKYVFRTRPHATMDAIAATLYLAEAQPNLKRVTGINQNYAFGQDSWNDFEASVKAIKPDAEILGSQMPKFGAGQYGAEISALLSSNADVIHSSLWGGDLEAFMIQAQPRNLFKKPQLVLVAGEPYLHRLPGRIPDGTIVGARGTNGVFAPESPLKQWLVETYKSKSGGLDPNYPAYSTAQAFLGVKAAFEKAKGKNAATPSSEDVVAAFEKLTFDSPSGKVAMNLGKGHQAVMGTAYGVTKTEN